jgi:hypothetical protein
MNDMETLPRLIDQAMATLDNATTAAEVLDARDRAKFAYDAAKSAARFAKTKSAHATILATCHRMQADALTIEARAQIGWQMNTAQRRNGAKLQNSPMVLPFATMYPARTRSPPSPISDLRANKSTKPVRCVMPRTASRA